MNAATIITPGLAGEAHAALHVAMEAPAGGPVKAAMVSLGTALDLYSAAYADVEGDPLGEALWNAAEGLSDATDALIAALAGMPGTEDEPKDAVVVGVTA